MNGLGEKKVQVKGLKEGGGGGGVGEGEDRRRRSEWVRKEEAFR